MLTPGPWTLDVEGAYVAVVVMGADGHPETTIARFPGGLAPYEDLLAERKANARAVAALPELVAAVVALMKADRTGDSRQQMDADFLGRIALNKAGLREGSGV